MEILRSGNANFAPQNCSKYTTQKSVLKTVNSVIKNGNSIRRNAYFALKTELVQRPEFGDQKIEILR